ncbi:hypothetical protein V1520DRAFT_214308 [Lipomyces starkeyi]|uniref:D-xylose 1-dehydrogenase (NADP(+), D-xylono-1,5-lactone-forming) n=1 Tax=Lipomyces starkeyi NRRL Y-11557 TaxID=675824 RepID=A0A1E3PY63_LIPST|nr:hypothetical protein LIPSTDRAFT_107358 [Lipomyces starkeyi NRRL Y-11557]
MVYTCHWGLVGAGEISELFLQDLLTVPATRGVTDVAHKPVAVAARSLDRAKTFIASHVPDLKDSIKAYGSYAEIVADSTIDVIYIGTTQSTHYEVALLALRAGKNVLCEKPFTINSKQAEHLALVAKEKNVFLMEAVWTRFFPLTIEFEKLIHKDMVIGPIRRVFTDFSVCCPADPSFRLYNLEAGGGALLDLGLYALMWMFLTCYKHPENHRSNPDVVKAVSLKSPLNVDESTAITTLWSKPKILCVSTCSLMMDSPSECVVRVQGDKGDVIIPIHGSRPEKIIINLTGEESKTLNFPIPGQGLFWEADAVARDIRDGKKVDDHYPIQDSILSMQIMDEVRRQNDFKFPDALEFVEDY